MAGEEKLGGAFIELRAPPGDLIDDLRKAKFSVLEFAAHATGLTDKIADFVKTVGGTLTAFVTAPFVALTAATTGGQIQGGSSLAEPSTKIPIPSTLPAMSQP